MVLLSWRYSTTASLGMWAPTRLRRRFILLMLDNTERPVILSAVSLLWTGLGLVLYARWTTGERGSGAQYLRQIARSRTRAELVNVLAVPVALVLRAFFFRHTLWWAQCTFQRGLVSQLPSTEASGRGGRRIGIFFRNQVLGKLLLILDISVLLPPCAAPGSRLGDTAARIYTAHNQRAIAQSAAGLVGAPR